MAWEKVLYFDKFHEQESRNYVPNLPAPKLWNELLFLYILSMCKLWQITYLYHEYSRIFMNW